MEWINVNDRLPELDDAWVLCTNGKWFDCAYYLGDDEWFDGNKNINPTHWMPLPEPPKKE